MCLKKKLRSCCLTLACLASLCLLVNVNLAVGADPPPKPGTTCTDCTDRLTFVNNCDDEAEIQMLQPADATAKAQWVFWNSYGDARYSGKDKDGKGAGDLYIVTKLKSKDQVTFGIPDKGVTSGRFSFALGCADQTADAPWGSCKLGPTPGQGWLSINSIFEITAGCRYQGTNSVKGKTSDDCVINGSDVKKGKLSEQDNFDLGAVDGFTIPLSIEVTNNADGTLKCTRNAVDGSLLDLASCPSEFTKGDTAKNTVQTLQLTPEDAKNQQLSAFFAKTDPISLLTKDRNGNVKACAAPCKWITANGDVGSPGTPVRIVPGEVYKNKDTQKLIPNTADYYCCACRGFNSTGGVKEPTDADCVFPGCSGVSCMDRFDRNPLITDDDRRYSMPMSNYVKRLKSMGFEGYTWQFDDKLGLVQCDKWGAQIKVTLCPAGSGGKPYDLANRKWSYSADAKKCIVGATGAYDSLFTCQSTDPNMKNKYKLMVPVAEINGQKRKNKTQNYCVSDPASGTMTLEECENKIAGEKSQSL